ncbi:MAG: HypC/HybG/HupF family hydrogenase formation chaperone [Clostridiales Family XIII bacterium]|jgi:hydrogenase expression/formation protein HypC|nr:HypC/HybG/HupF family hydrogenase formation chaperone [Clostridiales Family XIII bacterium]
MCVAYPGKVIGIEGRMAKVDFAGNVVDVNIGVVDTRPGDYVLVHAGCAIESMPESKAMEILEIFKDMEAL